MPDRPYRVWVDTETYCDVDLRLAGTYPYVASPSFRLLMTSWVTERDAPDAEPRVSTGEGDAEREWRAVLDDALAHRAVLVAHNAEFERLVLARAEPDLADPALWDDTAALAALHGLPRALGWAAVAAGLGGKDSAGTRLINLFCRPRRDGSRVTALDEPEKWAAFVGYCRQDVRVLRDLDRVLQHLGGWPPGERAVWETDQRVNDLGVAVDVDLARAAVEASGRLAAEAKNRMREVTGLANPNSVQQLRGWLADRGVELPDLTADTVRSTIESWEPRAIVGDPAAADVVDVLRDRQATAPAAVKKFRAVLSGEVEGRLRGQTRYHGAHTGRWAGRGMQIQNLPRLSYNRDEDAQAARDRVVSGQSDVDEVTLKRLVRSTLTGPLTVADYASIEARVLAWLAGERWSLAAFADGADIYVETAARMSTPGRRLTREQGKVAVLALGFGGAVNSLRVMGAGGTDGELVALVRAWREANPRVVELWADLADAFIAGSGVAGRLRVTSPPALPGGTPGGVRRIHLPGGRSITYRGVQVTRGPRGLEALYHEPKPGLPPCRTYGGRLAENVTQAVARDLLADLLVRLDTLGLPVVGHVHDEVLVEGDHLDTVLPLMRVGPPWAAGLPLAAEGYVCARYHKG